MAELWDRKENESTLRYDSFCIYRDMPHRPDNPQDRTLAKTAAELGKSHQLIERWSSQDGWIERAQAYDVFVEKASRRDQEKESLKMVKRHAKIGVLCQDKALKRLMSMNPEDFTAAQVIQLLQMGITIERQARGDPDQKDINQTQINIFAQPDKLKQIFGNKKYRLIEREILEAAADAASGEIIDAQVSEIEEPIDIPEVPAEPEEE